jgi:predicted phosphodiesterase
MINDFRYIDKFSTESAKKLFYSQYGRIKLNYEQRTKGKKQVIVTHFMPAQELVAEQYKHPSNSYMNAYFANDLADWMLDLENTTWIYGHTHIFTDMMVGTTRCVCNPCGYPRENHGFYNTEFCVEV